MALLAIIALLTIIEVLTPKPQGLGSVALADTGRLVSIYVDGQKKTVNTEASSVGRLLERAGVTLGREDIVEPAADTPLSGGLFNVNIYRSRPVLIVDGQQQVRSRSAYTSPRLIVQNAGVETYPEDTFESEIVTDFAADGLVGHKVTIRRATPVTLLADGKLLNLRTQAKTVEGLLAEKHIAMGEKDTIVPGRSTSISNGLKLVITRVNEVDLTRDEVLPRTTRTVKDAEMFIGQKRVVEEGSDGKRTVTYHIRYHNGVEVARQTVKVEGLVEPTTKVVAVGTKVPDDAWYRLRVCESGNNYQRNSGNGYYGAYQFDLSTWQSNGGSGYPHENLPEVQDEIARRLQARRGWQPWPICSVKLGLQ